MATKSHPLTELALWKSHFPDPSNPAYDPRSRLALDMTRNGGAMWVIGAEATGWLAHTTCHRASPVRAASRNGCLTNCLTTEVCSDGFRRTLGDWVVLSLTSTDVYGWPGNA